ncbi:MAG TPA: VWA domain-containing protein [Acidimicrobiales bacterium]
MTFLDLSRLALLLVPAGLVVAYLLVQRVRARTLVRFTNVDLLASVAPRRPGWQRHIPAAALVAALALMVVGLAHPARVVRTPRQKATVVLTLDTSGSMIADDVSPTRLGAAQQAARTFVQALPPGVQLGLVKFESTAEVLVSPTTDRATVLAAINQLTASGGTATGDGLDLALQAINTVPRAANGKPVPAAIVLMSDGVPMIGHGGLSPSEAVAAAAASARQQGVKVHTIAYGTQEGAIRFGDRVVAVPSDPAAMAAIASATGGHTFSARSSGQLKSVYRAIGRAVGYDVHRKDVAAWFTVLAFVVAALAAAAALYWTQRIA